MNNPIISIIVPIYKAELFLHECLDSIRNQSFENWECLLVDDGSPDSSGDICDEYALKDSRFKVFHKVNGGVSSARNTGIEHAKGEWIRFVDSDDKLNTESLHILYRATQDYNSELYIGAYSNDKGRQTEIKDKEWYDKIELIKYLRSNVLFGIPWNKLFKKEIIDKHKLHFNESISSFEDELFVIDYLRYVNKSVTISSSIYIYCNHAGEHLSRKFLPFDLRLKTSKLIYNSTINLSDTVSCKEEADYYHGRMMFRGVTWLYMFGVALPYTKRMIYLHKLLSYIKREKLNKIYEELMHGTYGFYSYNPVFLDFRIRLYSKILCIKDKYKK